MRLEELDYELPAELIAQTPAEPRDAARLLVYRRGSGDLEDRRFAELPRLLAPGDLLVRNDTRVLNARTHFRRQTGGRLEVLFLERREGGADGEVWEVLVRGRPRVDEVVALEHGEDETAGAAGPGSLEDGWRLRVEERLGEGRWLVRALDAEPVAARLERSGETPLPPYIKRRLADDERYQTTYARVAGSAAAPTAGLHFTPEVDRSLAERGIGVEELTLHVGLGTFQPVTAAEIETHRLHSEPYVLKRAVWERIARAKRAGRRVIAVGTTMTRLLETLARDPGLTPRDRPEPFLEPMRTDLESSALLRGRTALYITPGFELRIVDGLLTNFHLPRTSLLALVMAFCGVEETRMIYRHAIEERYRFYSFGDAMLAL